MGIPKRAARLAPAAAKRSVRPSVPGGRPGAAEDRRIVEGRVTEVLADGRARLVTASRRVVDCRCPQHVSVEWLRAAVAVAPIDAEASVGTGRTGTLWCLLPGPEHRDVIPDCLDLVARESVKIACGDSTVSLSKEGTVRVRGKDVTTRGSRVTRIQGGTVRIN
ncbi:MAG TPA: hypothetical protein VI456_00120 [Polyangia bacterium]